MDLTQEPLPTVHSTGTVLDMLLQSGPVISGVALLIGSAAAWSTLLFYHRKTLYAQWVDGFRQIYADFWKDEEISKVRRWIASDMEYEVLASILRRRLASDHNCLDADANEMLESLDRFLALIVRVRSFNKGKMNKDQRELWEALYEKFWIRKMYSRPEISNYIEKYWTYLYEQTKEVK